MKLSVLAAQKKKYAAAREAYTNATPIMSDAEYDRLEDAIRAADPTWKGLKTVGAAPVSRKVKLPHAMGSIAKIKADGSAAKWLKGNKSSLTLSAKADGVSAQFVADKNGNERLLTRGDGSTGSDITHLLPHIKGTRPKLRPGQAVRGELIIPIATFDKKYVSKFANPRNLVAGVVNAKKPDLKVAKDIEFVVHAQISPALPLHEAAPALKRQGFSVIAHTVVKAKDATEAKLATLLPEFKAKSKHELDGIVVEKHVGGDQRAFKGTDASADAEVDHVEWTASKHGLLKPVVVLKKAVSLSGTSIKRITGNNARFVVDNKIGKGAVVTVIRSGDVIPKIIGVTKPAKKPDLPTTPHEFTTTGADFQITKDNVEHKVVISAKQLEHFLVKAGIENVKSRMLEKLTAAGIDSVDKLIKASPTALKAAGFGPKQIITLQSQIKAKSGTMREPDLMAGSGVFPQGWGSRVFATLLAEIPLAELRATRPSDLLAKVAAVKGFGPKRAVQFATAFPKYLTFETTTGLKPAAKKAGGKLTGKRFTFSGFRDKTLQQQIEDSGAIYADSLAKTTTHVVFRTKADMSGTKWEKARTQPGTACITLDQLNRLLKSKG